MPLVVTALQATVRQAAAPGQVAPWAAVSLVTVAPMAVLPTAGPPAIRRGMAFSATACGTGSPGAEPRCAGFPVTQPEAEPGGLARRFSPRPAHTAALRGQGEVLMACDAGTTRMHERILPPRARAEVKHGAAHEASGDRDVAQTRLARVWRMSRGRSGAVLPDLLQGARCAADRRREGGVRTLPGQGRVPAVRSGQQAGLRRVGRHERGGTQGNAQPAGWCPPAASGGDGVTRGTASPGTARNPPDSRCAARRDTLSHRCSRCLTDARAVSPMLALSHRCSRCLPPVPPARRGVPGWPAGPPAYEAPGWARPPMPAAGPLLFQMTLKMLPPASGETLSSVMPPDDTRSIPVGRAVPMGDPSAVAPVKVTVPKSASGRGWPLAVQQGASAITSAEERAGSWARCLTVWLQPAVVSASFSVKLPLPV